MRLYNTITMVLDTDRGGKGRRFESRFIEAGLASYKNQGGKVILVKKESLDRFAHTMVGCPVIIEHSNVDDYNVKELSVGVVSRVWFNESDGWYYCEGIINDANAETLIEEKNWSVSCGYLVTEKDQQGGMWHDIEYDEEVLNGNFEHLAIVSSPRYRDATILLNSTEEKRAEMFNIFNSKKIRNKGDEMKKDKEETVENASEDKRDIIREIMAISAKKESEFKGGEDEKIETIAKLAEKLAYESSESERKDNESDEKEEEKENKCNESDEKYDEKEEKENSKKVRNSSESFKTVEKLRNSCAEIEPKCSYMNEKERLARGNTY